MKIILLIVSAGVILGFCGWYAAKPAEQQAPRSSFGYAKPIVSGKGW